MRRVSSAIGSSRRSETWRVISEFALVVVMVSHFHALDIEIKRLTDNNPGGPNPSS